MGDFSKSLLLSFMLKSLRLSEILRKPITALHMQNGELKALIFHCSPVLTTGHVKNQYSCAWPVGYVMGN